MVDVRMRDEKRRDSRWVVCERLKVLPLREPASLLQAAINQYLCITRFQKIVRAGHRTRAAMEGKFHLENNSIIRIVH